MLKLNRSFNLFKYFGRQSRIFTISIVKSRNYSGRFVSSNFEKLGPNKFMNQTDVINQIEDPMEVPSGVDFCKEKLRLGKDIMMIIKLQQGKSGKRTIQLTKIYRTGNTGMKWEYLDLPKLLVPEDSIKIIKALDQIIIACDGEKFYDEKNSNKKLSSEEIITDFCDISLILFRNEKGKLLLDYFLKMKTENRIIERSFFIPLNSLLWIRQTIAKILEKYEGNEKLPEMPIVELDLPDNYQTARPSVALKELQLGRYNYITIELRQGKSGRQTIQLTNIYKMQNREEWINLHLPKLLPEDAYNFVRALDEIIMACNGEQVFDSSNFNKELASVGIITEIYDISLVLLRNERGLLQLKFFQKKKLEHGKPVERLNSFSIPSTSLFWIRETMAKILEEFDGSEVLKLPFNQFPFILEDKKDPREEDLFQKELKTGENNFMKIKLEKGKTGIKTIKLTKMYKKQNEWKFENLPKLMVPEDAYNFVRALDRIIMACSGEQIFDEKNSNKKLSSEEIITDFCDISLILFRNEKGKLLLEYFIEMKTENGITLHSFFIPLNSLLWIRETLAKLLEENDGSEELLRLPIIEFPFILKDKEAPNFILKKLQIGEDAYLRISLGQGKSGNIFIQLVKMYKTQNEWKYINFPKLLVPDDIYKFIRALDQIIIACDGEKLFDLLNANKELLASKNIPTDFYDISLVLFRNENGKLCLQFFEKRKSDQQLNSFYISSNYSLWIRETIAKLLEECDGNEKLLELPKIEFPFILNR